MEAKIKRFTGTCVAFTVVDHRALTDWITSISLSDWPQQTPENGELRPAMVNDLAWHGFGSVTEPLVQELMRHFPGCRDDVRMLSVLMPGAAIPAHADEQPEGWIARVQVPLTTDDQSVVCVTGEVHYMRPGKAYLFNAAAEHFSVNRGTAPRIHFMFDVKLR